MPIDHFGIRIPASKWAATTVFYEKALAPLGYKVLASFVDGDVLGMGDKHPDLWLTKVPDTASVGDGTHFAFTVEKREQVEAFHTEGISGGGSCNGPPGLRPHYGPTYYGGFVYDPVGNNVEVVTRSPQ
ncbi:hypothetical protein TWF730_001373 [Orbilia blumenaviensis]|uniref:VOC domain-containing protein n=1 Tax=Orbilia blumenaviensis TaxID=1796055 RepID=A0AAV9UKW2_9PEZI